MTSSKAPLSQFVQPNIDEARLERQFGAIRASFGRRAPSRATWLTLSFAAAALIALIVFGLRTSAPLPAGDLAQFETGAVEGQTVTLSDGSRVMIDAQSSLALGEIGPNRIRLALKSGGVICDVAKNPKRAFLVEAAGYAVKVVGTRFSVRITEIEGEWKLVVAVERGSVEVSRLGTSETRLLAAGETWSASAVGVAPPVALSAAAAPAPAPEPAAGDSASGDAPAAPVESAAAPATKPGESAKQLFERAARARAAGRTAEAREALIQLRSRYPNDPRAGLATFELARLEQDDGKDPKAASKLLSEAIEKAPPGSALREDAEARRIEALEKAGDTSACQKAKGSFLSQYPTSVHRARVLRACPRP